MSEAPTLGFIGLGAMGRPMAKRLLDAGATVVVFDVSSAAVASLQSAGAAAADSPRSVADAASLVFTSLPSPDSLREVTLGADGIVEGRAVQAFVDLSTTGASTAGEVASALASAGIAYVDAPVSGGVRGAETGRLTLMVSGDAAAIDGARPWLAILGDKLFVVGPLPGHAQVAKVINNLLSAAAIVLTAETAILGQKAGLDLPALLEAVGAGSGTNSAVTDKFPNQVLTRRFAHGFRLELMAKDVRLCLEEARRLDVPMLVGGVVDQFWALADNLLASDADCTEMVKVVENLAGSPLLQVGT